MEFYRYVLLILENEDDKGGLLNKLSDWEYSNKLDTLLYSSGYSFVLINKKENIKIYFKKLKDCVYTSINVLPNITNGEICEPQEKKIHDDILFNLCMAIKKEFVNGEILCGIIPSEND